MVAITETLHGISVEGEAYKETFRNRFKAFMAAHAIALGEATAKQAPVVIKVPSAWGEPVTIPPATRLAA